MAIGDSQGILLKIKGDSSSAITAVKATRTEIDAATVSTKNLSSSFSGIGGPAAIAAAAIAGVALVGAKLATTLFDLAKNAAEYGSKIYDASQKTGLSAQTLTALKYAADQAGSSFEQVTKGVVLFGAEVGKAGQKNEEAKAKMKELGVTSTDLRTALGQAVQTIYEAKSSTEQLTLASEAFGRKIGPDLIPLIKDAEGNLDKLEETAKKLGLTITDEAAAAADQFGDQLDTLSAQAHGVGIVIGNELIPIFNEMAHDVSEWLARNQGEIKKWADNLVFGIREAIANWDRYAAILERVADLGQVIASGGALVARDEFSRRDAERQKRIDRANAFDRGEDPDFPGGFHPDIGTPYLPGGKRDSDLKKHLDTEKDKSTKAIKHASTEMRKFFEGIDFVVTDQNRPAGTKVAGTDRISKHSTGEAVDLRTRDKTVKEIVNVIAAGLEHGFRFYDERLMKGQPHLHVEANTLKPSTFYDNPALYGGEENLAALKALDAQRISKKGGQSTLDKQLADQRKETEVDIYEFATKYQQKLMQENLARFAAESKARVASVQAALEEGSITVTKAAEQIQQIRLDQLKEELRYVSDINGFTYDSNKAYQLQEEINAQLLDDYREQLKIQKELREGLDDFIEKEQERFQSSVEANSLSVGGIEPGQFRYDAKTGLFEMVEATDELTDAQQRQKDANEELTESWGRLRDAMEDAGSVQMAGIDIAQMGLDLFGNMIGALENAIERWLLYGESVGKALKMALAQELAHIAARAAIKALEATAEGFILLAFGQYDKAASAFTAAALYAALAVGAGLAAKALAPKQQAKPTGGAASAGASSRSTGSRGESGQIYSPYGSDATILNVNRNQSEQPVTHRVTVELKLDKNGVLQVFHDDVNNNGRTKGLLVDVVAATT